MDALVEEATVDAYDEYEQFTGFEVMVTGHLELPFPIKWYCGYLSAADPPSFTG